MTHTRTFTLEERALEYMLAAKPVKVHSQDGARVYDGLIKSILVPAKEGCPSRVWVTLTAPGDAAELFGRYGVQMELTYDTVKFV